MFLPRPKNEVIGCPGGRLLTPFDHCVLPSLASCVLILLGKIAAGDGNAVRLSGGLVTGGDGQNMVGIDIEGNLDLRDTTGSKGDVGEFEFSEESVVLGTGTFTLVNLDEHTRLVVGAGGEDLGLLGGDGGSSLDESGHDTTSGPDAEGDRGDIKQE